MSQPVQESYGPRPMAANAAGVIVGSNGGAIGGFLCVVSGTVTLNFGSDNTGTTFVDAVPVTAGVFLPMPFEIPPGSYAYATLAGGAKGTFAIL